MNVEQIKHHPFFYGVNWTAIRQIDAPFIPRLKSITDTSYFPTDELEQVPDEPVGGDTTGANKDLAFLGYVLSPFFSRYNFRESSLSFRVWYGITIRPTLFAFVDLISIYSYTSTSCRSLMTN